MTYSEAMLLVDAANVVGSRPDGWWRDRPAAADRLVREIRAAAAASRLPLPVVVVLEGAARGGVAEGTADRVEVVHARGSGDDLLAALAARAAADPVDPADANNPVVLVSADRGLRARTRPGVRAVGPRWLLERIDAPPGDRAAGGHRP
jgi:hypothetical protein